MDVLMSSIDKINYGKCVLVQDCKASECENDTYVLPGIDEANRREQFDALWFDSDNRRKYECHLPFSECHYDVRCILDAMHQEISAHTQNKPIDLVGMSYGGILSQVYAYEHPETVEKIALITSFSDLRKWYIEVRRLLNPEQVEGLEKYHTEKTILEKHPAQEYFEYNCMIDNIMGIPPNKKNAERYDDPFCFHGHFGIPQRARDRLKHFIE